MDTPRLDKKTIFSEFDDEERRTLIAELVRRFPEIRRIPRCRLFFLWFSDLEVLKGRLRSTENLESVILTISDEPSADLAGIWAGSKHFPKETGILTPQPRSSRIPGPQRSRSGSPQEKAAPIRSRTSPDRENPSLERDKRMKNLAQYRDNFQCVLTQQGNPMLEVSHIMPHKMHGSTKEMDWIRLQFFWGTEQVRNLKREILGDNGRMNTEQIHNLITFSSTLHKAWDRCLCAFRPVQVNKEETRMDVAFHWLPLRDDRLRQKDKVLCLENPYSANDLPKWTPGNNNYVYDMGTQRVIPSGYIFTVKTDNPKERPLPSFALLQLQWNLHRIAAMQGAAEDEDSDLDSDGDSVAVPSGSRSPVKDLRAEDTAPSRSPTRSLSPTKSRDLSIAEEHPGQLSER
ncbi:hypothetical protein N7490_011087 [Penicillium lividum]|nr:hypothetical protein N7490_011087 [Penicillium lividum]